MLDVNDARQRRRFHLERSLRKRPIGAGSDLAFLMALQRTELPVKPAEIFGDIPYLVVGGVATRAYAPERMTKDVDFLLHQTQFETARQRLQNNGFTKRVDLRFPSTSLGLFGEAWTNGDLEIDILSSEQAWVTAAFEGHAEDQTGLRVIPLPYLVLMKYESARTIDNADIERMLARLSDTEVERIIAVVRQHSGDPNIVEELRQFAEIGRWELGNQPN